MTSIKKKITCCIQCLTCLCKQMLKPAIPLPHTVCFISEPIPYASYLAQQLVHVYLSSFGATLSSF